MVVAAAKCVQGGTVAKHLFICRLSMKGALDGKSENEAQELRSVCNVNRIGVVCCFAAYVVVHPAGYRTHLLSAPT